VKILQLSTHSTLVPRHGGQLRSHYIGRCLENSGFDVARVAVCWRTELDIENVREPIVDLRLSRLWASKQYQSTLAWWPHLDDYYLASAVAQTPALLDRLLTQIADCSPGAILLEHPWTWPLVKHLPGVRSGAIRIVYSSQNVEAPLKRQTVRVAGLPVPSELLDEVEALERDLVASAWATAACTPADAAMFRAWGARQVVVARNGTVARSREHLLDALPMPLLPAHRFVLFVGSRHVPNMSGFFKYVVPVLSGLRPNTRVVLVGSMCEPIDEQIARSSMSKYRHGRLVSLGIVDDITLDALIVNASAILLPIDYGGGSNVKTAEALASGRPIVATSTSFRGFTEYQTLEHVTIADTPQQFEAAIDVALSSLQVRPSELPVPRELLWEAALEPLIQLMRSMPAGAHVLAPQGTVGDSPRY
jgi:Glycosyl transferases group 1